MTADQSELTGSTIAIAVPVDLPPEEAENLPEHERLGIVVGMVYGNALADRDQAQAQVAGLEADLADLRQAAQDVLALDLVRHPTFAHDEQTLKRLEDLAYPAGTVDLSDEKEG